MHTQPLVPGRSSFIWPSSPGQSMIVAPEASAAGAACRAWSIFAGFRLFDRVDGPPVVAFEDVVVDTRLGGGDPELVRRVRTMEQFVRGIPGLGPVELAPHERAIEAVARGARDHARGPEVIIEAGMQGS